MPERFEVHVVPRSPRPGPDGRHDGVPRLRVSAPPDGGRANEEVERLLGELLGCRVRVVGGRRSRRKLLEADADPSGGLSRAFGPP